MRRAIAIIILALTAAACDQAGPQDDQIQDNSFVSDVRGCADLEAEIERLAIREMNAQIDALIASLDDRRGFFGIGTAADSRAVSPAAPPASPAPNRESATDYTTTNTQERDVDEPDFIKNDGSRIFLLHGTRLVTLRAWPPESAGIESTVDLQGQPTEMFLLRDRVIVFAQLGSWGPYYGGSFAPPSPSQSGTASTGITVYDVSGPVPAVIHRQEIEGRYVSARRTGDAIRLVSVAPMKGPELVYWPDGNIDWSKPSAVRGALEQARRQNIKRIKDTPLSEWLPHAFEDGREVVRDCGSFSSTNVSAHLGYTTVTTLDLSRLATSHRTILNTVNEVYASRDALYLTTRHYWTTPPSDKQVRQDHTYIFQFDIGSSGSAVRYVASGGVPGHIVDQFALDEESGFLRIATTRETTIGWSVQDKVNNLFVLRADGDRLNVVGEITGLARNELIYSARFDGPRGFLVTYRKVDPLFTLDLGNPRAPRVVGELKIPGYSTYLHPLDRDHLLTIGRDATEQGFFQAIQLQIFDVSNFADPKVQHRLALGSRSSSSDALDQHKAFNYFASRGLLTIPFSDYSAARLRGFSSSLEVLRATVADGIVSLGSIEHGDLVQGTDARRYYGWMPTVRRGVMMDDFVYSISFGGMKVHSVRDLSRPVATVLFP